MDSSIPTPTNCGWSRTAAVSRLKRFFAAKGGALLDQAYIYETNKNVGQALDEAGIEVVDFVRASVTE